MKNKITPEQFVIAWQQSNSVREVCDKTGMVQRAVVSRAQYYRGRKVPLKFFPRKHVEKCDFKALADLATRYAPPDRQRDKAKQQQQQK